MVEQQKYKAYAAATQTIAPVRQIILLYEAIIRCVQQSKEAINENRIEDRYNLLIKASNLIGGLQGCLDFDNGGDIARILYSYYASMDARIFSIHRTNSIEDCEAIVEDLKQMRDAWEDVSKNVNDSAENNASAHEDTNVDKSSVSSDGGNTPPPSTDGLTLSA
ncbi:MAG: flagellar protein FliS [Rickettsiales bacterium]